MKVAPFAQPACVEKIGLRPAAQRIPALGWRHRAPDAEQREKVRLGIRHRAVCRSRSLLRVLGAFARIGNAQARGDDEHLGEHALLLRLEHHAAERGIDRQPREFVAERGHLVLVVQRAELVQERVARLHCGVRWRIQKGKRLHFAEAERLHPQNHLGEIGALDLRLRERRARGKILLRVEPHAHAVPHAARAARALVGAALRDGLDGQALRARARIVAADAREAGINHVADARNRERSLGDIRGHDHAPPLPRRKNPLLIRRRHASEKSEHLEIFPECAFERVAGVADVALRREEDEDVAIVRLDERLLDCADDILHEPFAFLVRRVLVAHFDGKEPSARLDDRRICKRRRERLRINRRRGDHDLQIRPALQQAAQVAEEKINVQRTLVRLVHDDDRVCAQHRVALDLREQDAVRHEFHERVAASVVAEAHLAPDLAAPLHIQLLGHAARHAGCRHAPRLRAADAPARPCREQPLEAHLRKLRCLA